MDKPSRGGIKHISDLFAAYQKRLQAPPRHVASITAEVISDVLGITVQPDQVTFTPHNHTVTLTVPGPVKTEVLRAEATIINHLKGRLGTKSAPRKIR